MSMFLVQDPGPKSLRALIHSPYESRMEGLVFDLALLNTKVSLLFWFGDSFPANEMHFPIFRSCSPNEVPLDSIDSLCCFGG